MMKKESYMLYPLKTEIIIENKKYYITGIQITNFNIHYELIFYDLLNTCADRKILEEKELISLLNKKDDSINV